MLGLAQVFFNPGLLLRRIRDGNQNWLVPFAACLLLGIATTALLFHFIGYENLVRRSFESNPFAARMDPEQKRDALKSALSPGRRLAAYAAGPVVSTVNVFGLAALLTLALGVLGSQTAYFKVLTFVSYGLYAFSLLTFCFRCEALLALPDPREADPRQLLMLNAGFWLDERKTGPFLFSLASSADLLGIALVFYLAFGLSRIAPRVGLPAALSTVGGLWLVYVLGSAVLSSVSGGML